MATVKIIINFSKMKDDDLDTKSQVIINNMTDNASYPAPVPSLEVVTAKRTDYVNALATSRTGGKEETALKNQARKTLEESLRLLGLYVQANCKNDEAVALSSGFDIQKSPTPVGTLAKPTNFVVENGDSASSLMLSCDKIAGAKSYIFQMTVAPVTGTSVWETRFSTSKSFTFEHLTPGKQYAFRIAGIGADPTLVYSDVVLRFAQ